MLLVYIFAVILAAGFLQALTGFGFALVATPLLMIVMSAKEVVIFNILLSSILLLIMTYKTRDYPCLPDLKKMIFPCIIGMFVGSCIMGIIDDKLLKISIGIILFLTILQRHINMDKFVKRKISPIETGFYSGFLGASTSLSGPPVFLYFSNCQEDKNIIRANLVRFFFFGNLIVLSIFFFFGYLSINFMDIRFWGGIIVVLIGYFGGNKLFCFISVKWFQKIGEGIVLLGAILSIMNGLK